MMDVGVGCMLFDERNEGSFISLFEKKNNEGSVGIAGHARGSHGSKSVKWMCYITSWRREDGWRANGDDKGRARSCSLLTASG